MYANFSVDNLYSISHKSTAALVSANFNIVQIHVDLGLLTWFVKTVNPQQWLLPALEYWFKVLK